MASDAPRSPDSRYAPTVVGEREREQVVRRLGDHFAQDHLSLDEYEFRVQAALRATQWYELTATTNDLPALDVDALRVAATPTGFIPGLRRMVVAFMGGVVRRGQWLVPPRLGAIAVMGGGVLDLRDATLSAHVTEVFAVAVMGGIEIKVPPGVRLESDGIAIMGGFEDQAGFPALGHADAPVVRVRGIALMGGVITRMQPRGWHDEDDD